jgi:hypothetical protein
VRELAEQLAPIFDSQGVHREALAALQLFVEAAKAERATAEFVRKVLDYLNRSRYNSEVHFDAECCAPSPKRLPDVRERGQENEVA